MLASNLAMAALGLWAGIHYMSNEASLFYGLIAGLSDIANPNH